MIEPVLSDWPISKNIQQNYTVNLTTDYMNHQITQKLPYNRMLLLTTRWRHYGKRPVFSGLETAKCHLGPYMAPAHLLRLLAILVLNAAHLDQASEPLLTMMVYYQAADGVAHADFY